MKKSAVTFLGGMGGAIFGVALILVLLLWDYPPPKTKSDGGDSHALALGMALMFGVPFGAIVGFVFGAIATFIYVTIKRRR